MSGFHPPIKKEIKDEILAKVKEGKKVPELAKIYGISESAIYHWVGAGATGEPGTLELSRLKRENQELYTLIGKITADLERSKKNRAR